MSEEIRYPVVPPVATIGESFSWIVVDGEVREVTGVSPEGLPTVSGPLDEEQKARWARICNQHE